MNGSTACSTKCGGGGSSNKARAILNGVVGDYLDTTRNELAINMNLYPSPSGSDEPVDVSVADLALLDAGRPASSCTSSKTKRRRVCILVHGLTDDESTWIMDDGTDYGSLLRRDHNILPLYLRYNTGLHVSTNGQKLSLLLQSLYQYCGSQIDSVSIIAHSMGGLVTRSACLNAKRRNMSWVRNVSHVVFLGTPHHGSPWEKIGNAVSHVLDAVPRPYMKLAANVANLRSSGIKDLRYGYVLDEDWAGHDPNGLLDNTKVQDGSDLLPWSKYFAATGTVTVNPNHFASHLVGDALVRKDSAMGRSNDKVHDLDLDPENIQEFAGVGHIHLSSNMDVYRQIEDWITQPWDAYPSPSDYWEYNEGEGREDIETEQQSVAQSPSYDGKWSQARGLTTLIQDSVDKGTRAVEGVQRELTDEVYSVLTMIPAIAPAARTVHAVQDTCVGSVYSIIRGVNFGIGEATKQAFAMIENKE
mmetsp:Transcript_5204/g.11009  ORF Transcript_5204/g.11009 Transcript_5204/m.11009 type:complete len:473 (-) Transcript_5204:36-1454(-)